MASGEAASALRRPGSSLQFVIMIREAETQSKERSAKKGRFYRVFLTIAAPKADKTGLQPLRQSFFTGCRSLRDGRDGLGWAGSKQPQQLSQVPIQLGELLR